jgi:photosystem II stability/assembly factor-like uncharacterized protein
MRDVLWSIDASPDAGGGVQRSTDGGRTWESVTVTYQSSFGAVAAAGSDVWAGTSSGTLFHSSDNGTTWVHVPVMDQDTKLTEGIASIDIAEDGKLTLKTTTGRQWVSTDSGAHWKQQ